MLQGRRHCIRHFVRHSLWNCRSRCSCQDTDQSSAIFYIYAAFALVWHDYQPGDCFGLCSTCIPVRQALSVRKSLPENMIDMWLEACRQASIVVFIALQSKTSSPRMTVHEGKALLHPGLYIVSILDWTCLFLFWSQMTDKLICVLFSGYLCADQPY